MDQRRRAREKSLSLRQYEGAPLPVGSDGGLDFYSPFGPMIAKAAAPAALVRRINAYADRLVTPGASGEFLIPPEVAVDGSSDSLLAVAEGLIRRYVAGVNRTPAPPIEVELFWLVSQVAGTPSPVHFHSGDISGVLYLKTPEIEREDEEEEKTYISNRQAGYINFILGGRQPLSRSLVSFKPKVGDFYVFPGWLLHGAEPFRGSGERRSLAFNARLAAG